MWQDGAMGVIEVMGVMKAMEMVEVPQRGDVGPGCSVRRHSYSLACMSYELV